jgi:hypothetical protein
MIFQDQVLSKIEPRLAPYRRTGPAENYRAAVEATARAGQSDSRRRNLADQYAPIVEALNATRAADDKLPNPIPDLWRAQPAGSFRWQSIHHGQDYEPLIWREIEARRLAEPGFLAGIDRESVHKSAEAEAAKAQREWERVSGRSTRAGWWGGFAGATLQSLTDPINLATALFGAGAGATIRNRSARR